MCTDDLCQKYSFYGKRLEKKPFSTLLMKNILISKAFFKYFLWKRDIFYFKSLITTNNKIKNIIKF